MGKSLVIAEKPSVGRDLARVLNCTQNEKGYFSGNKYIVTWALGHLVTLADPEKYDVKYNNWKLEDLPMLPAQMELVVIKNTAKQFGVIRDLLKRPDIEEIIIATDAGREGELVARWIIKKAGSKKPVKRLWISSQTEKAIREGFNNLRAGKEYESLFASAECRAEADWLVGLNVTRALTCKHNAQLSAGRVQTPTLAMVVEREKQIKGFVPQDYWTISAATKGFSLHWQDKAGGQTRIFDYNKAKEIVQKVTGYQAEVVEVKKEPKKELPPLAYDLTELQRDANRRFGFSAKKTSAIMQQLYESHKLVTYPRTDSRYISEDIVPTLPERLKSVAVGPYLELVRILLKSGIKPTKRFVDNAKVTDHHAIIPTEEPVSLGRLSSEERRIYDLIVKRFIAVLSSPFQYEQTTVKAVINGETFTAKGKTVKNPGWRNVYQGMEEESAEREKEQEQALPEIKKGDRLEVITVKAVAGKTKPPARFTEATLLSAMEHPGKLLEDESLRETMDKTNGLGTPATRAEIIDKLFTSFYLERQGTEIIPTSKGVQLIELVPPELKSPELTAKWEQQLAEITRGRVGREQFISGIRDYAAKLVSTVAGSRQAFRHDNLTRSKCPECGKYLLEVKGKHGQMLICQDRECGYRKGLAINSNARCPQCHKKMEIRGEGDNKTFTCTCGFREKLAAFNKRKDEQKGNMTKKEVSRFLQEQNRNRKEPLNTALADALAKLKGEL